MFATAILVTTLKLWDDGAMRVRHVRENFPTLEACHVRARETLNMQVEGVFLMHVECVVVKAHRQRA
jgi:hypothetical protein